MRAKALWLILVLLVLSVHVKGQGPAATGQPPSLSISPKKSVGFVRVQYLKGSEPWEARGTGFFVFVEDKRFGEHAGFVYLVTNRHVAEPEENGQKFRVLKVSLRLNLKRPGQGGESEEGLLPLGGSLHWYFPADDAVDLAILPFNPDLGKYDLVPFPSSMFATKDVIAEYHITEGDQVLFTGFFYQFPGLNKIEPITREGILAMMPDEPMETTLRKPGRLYLADVHAFAGNSGAPLFVSVVGFRNGVMTTAPYPYRLLGVVSGYMVEDVDFKLRVATTLEGKAAANSGISTVVPADELKAMLDSPELQKLRDAEGAVRKRSGN